MKRFSQALDLKKRQTATQKSAFEPSGPSGWHLSRFLYHEATKWISTTPWIGCQSIAGLPLILNLPVLSYTPAWVKRGSVRVKCFTKKKNSTMFPVRAWTQTAWNIKEIQKSNNRLLFVFFAIHRQNLTSPSSWDRVSLKILTWESFIVFFFFIRWLTYLLLLTALHNQAPLVTLIFTQTASHSANQIKKWW